MKREFLKSIEGLTDAAIDKIMTENGNDVNNAKKDAGKLQADLQAANDTIKRITGELDSLREKNASAEDWKSKYETILEEQKSAKLEREKAEKEVRERADFDSVAVDKDGKPLEFIHDAVRESYFRKYVEAKAAKENAAKTGADIFKDLIKDDHCIKVPTPTAPLAGGSGTHEGGNVTKEQFRKMSYSERTQIFEQNPEMYKALTEN